jgi:hypothetical protein
MLSLRTGALAAALMLFAAFPLTAQQAQQPSGVLTLTGDLNRPYEVIDGEAWVEEVDSDALRTWKGQYEQALRSVFRRVSQDVSRAGGNALIYMHVQLLEGSGGGRGGPRGLLLVTGTVVRATPPAPTAGPSPR